MGYRSVKAVEQVLNESTQPEAWLLHFNQTGKLILSIKKEGEIVHTNFPTELSLDDVENKYDKTKALNAPIKLAELQSKRYYWGAISSEETNGILSQAQEGAWMIRYNKEQGRFAISQKKEGKIQHTLLNLDWALASIESENGKLGYGISKALFVSSLNSVQLF